MDHHFGSHQVHSDQMKAEQEIRIICRQAQ